MSSDFAAFTAVGSVSSLPCGSGDSIQATLADFALTVDGLSVGGDTSGRAESMVLATSFSTFSFQITD